MLVFWVITIILGSGLSNHILNKDYKVEKGKIENQNETIKVF